MVLSTASIAGGALFAPIIWSLFSKRPTGFSVVSATVIALVINLFFKVISPTLLDIKLSRALETSLGMGIPLFVMLCFELYYGSKGKFSSKAILMVSATQQKPIAKTEEVIADATAQNLFGIRVIGISMFVVGVGISLLGYLSSKFSGIVFGVGTVILLCSLIIIYSARNKSN